MAKKVTGELYESITGQLFELGRQLRQKGGYPFNPKLLQKCLQSAIEGKFKYFLAIRPFNAVEFVDVDCTIWKGPPDGKGLEGEEDIDFRSFKLTEIDISKIVFTSCLKDGEYCPINGEEMLHRLKTKTNFIRCGASVFFALWLDWQTNKQYSFLEQLYKEKGITHMYFFGTVLRTQTGCRFVLSLVREHKGKWDWGNECLKEDWVNNSINGEIYKLVPGFVI